MFKTAKKFAVFLLCCAVVLPLLSVSARADIVTDTLTVKVGYYGMEPDDYVEVGTWNWAELEERLPQHEVAYSFFRSSLTGEHTAVVESAYGFYIKDLLDFCGISRGDIQSVSFYTRDKDVGSFTSFTYSELFQTRYYFRNLAMNLDPVLNNLGVQQYDDAGRPLFYEDEAWADCEAVEPILALEDRWEQFYVGSSYETPPNFEGTSPANRFRLLFGQSEPTEARTNQSAKYVHTVLVTLEGTAIYCAETPELDGTIGSHTVQMNMTVSNGNLLEAIQGIMSYQSTDGTVMEVKGWSVLKSDKASDLVTVEISYEVYKEGNAGIVGLIGNASAPVVQTGTTAVRSDSSGEEIGRADDNTGGEAENETENKTDTGTENKTDNKTDTESESKTSETATDEEDTGGIRLVVNDSELPAMQIQLVDAEPVTAAVKKVNSVVIPLSPEAVERLLGEKPDTAENSEETEEEQESGEERKALEIQEPDEDNSEILWVAIAFILLAALGAASELIIYSKERGTFKT